MSLDKKIVKVQGKEIGKDNPLICVPLVGKDEESILIELEKIIKKTPDMIEWRADHFQDLEDESKVIKILNKIRLKTKETPIIFTIRSTKEGGEEISLSEQEKINLIVKICESGTIDLFDYELVNEKEYIYLLRDTASQNGVKLILSYHNFESTPDVETLVGKCVEMAAIGADIAKISVMPKSMDDVLLLLKATEEANQKVKTPLITISMGKYGSITRMSGWLFGSAVTFAIGEQSSAPGQVPIEELRKILHLMKKNI